MTPLNLTRHSHIDRETRVIRIQALQAISFATRIERDWGELAREAVESNHQRANVRREFRGV